MIVEKVGNEAADRLISLFKDAYPNRNPADILFCDATFREPTSRYARQRAADGGKVWTYMYALDSSIDSSRTPWHSIDIPLIFDNADTAPASVNREHTEEIQKIMVESLGQFMRTGDPNLTDSLCWNPVTKDDEWTMIYEEKPRTALNYDRALMPELIKYAKELGNGFGFNPNTDY
jgi:para-nitrobenzyl esterase